MQLTRWRRLTVSRNLDGARIYINIALRHTRRTCASTQCGHDIVHRLPTVRRIPGALEGARPVSRGQRRHAHGVLLVHLRRGQRHPCWRGCTATGMARIPTANSSRRRSPEVQDACDTQVYFAFCPWCWVRSEEGGREEGEKARERERGREGEKAREREGGGPAGPPPPQPIRLRLPPLMNSLQCQCARAPNDAPTANATGCALQHCALTLRPDRCTRIGLHACVRARPYPLADLAQPAAATGVSAGAAAAFGARARLPTQGTRRVRLGVHGPAPRFW